MLYLAIGLICFGVLVFAGRAYRYFEPALRSVHYVRKMQDRSSAYVDLKRRVYDQLHPILKAADLQYLDPDSLVIAELRLGRGFSYGFRMSTHGGLSLDMAAMLVMETKSGWVDREAPMVPDVFAVNLQCSNCGPKHNRPLMAVSSNMRPKGAAVCTHCDYSFEVSHITATFIEDDKGEMELYGSVDKLEDWLALSSDTDPLNLHFNALTFRDELAALPALIASMDNELFREERGDELHFITTYVDTLNAR